MDYKYSECDIRIQEKYAWLPVHVKLYENDKKNKGWVWFCKYFSKERLEPIKSFRSNSIEWIWVTQINFLIKNENYSN